MIRPYEITVPVVRRHMGGTLHYTVVELPADLAAVLPFEGPRLRVEGEVDGHPFEGTWMPGAGGPQYLMTPARMLAAIGKDVGDLVTVRFALADPDRVDEPPELAEALAEHPDLRAVWDGFSPGTRRGLVHRVASAKRPGTRARRVAEILELLAG